MHCLPIHDLHWHGIVMWFGALEPENSYIREADAVLRLSCAGGYLHHLQPVSEARAPGTRSCPSSLSSKVEGSPEHFGCRTSV